MQRRRAGTLGAAAVVAILWMGSTAQAAPARTAWSTYLRSGPGETAPVLDELSHDTLVDVQGCAGRWCRIVDGRTMGYIDKDALALPKPPLAEAADGPQTCFISDQVDYRKAARTRFCETRPTGH